MCDISLCALSLSLYRFLFHSFSLSLPPLTEKSSNLSPINIRQCKDSLNDNEIWFFPYVSSLLWFKIKILISTCVVYRFRFSFSFWKWRLRSLPWAKVIKNSLRKNQIGQQICWGIALYMYICLTVVRKQIPKGELEQALN